MKTTEISEAFIESGMDLKIRRDWALVQAAKSGYILTVKELMESGANCLAWRCWALKLAMKSKKWEVVKFLKEQINLKNK
jgi:hypothetical protein